MSNLIMWSLSGGFWRWIGFMFVVGMFLTFVLKLIAIILNRDWVADDEE